MFWILVFSFFFCKLDFSFLFCLLGFLLDLCVDVFFDFVCGWWKFVDCEREIKVEENFVSVFFVVGGDCLDFLYENDFFCEMLLVLIFGVFELDEVVVFLFFSLVIGVVVLEDLLDLV